jgi:heme a synthase
MRRAWRQFALNALSDRAHRIGAVAVIDRFERFARITLGYNVFVILWGAFVRASGSGAGCGDHWPLCDGSLIPPTPALTTLIELFHRATSGVALILIALLFVRARRAFPVGHMARTASGASLVIVIIEALIGALIVRAGLFGDNASYARAIMVALHFVNTLLLVAALTLAAWWARHPAPFGTIADGLLRRMLLIGIIGWLALGMTGAVGALSRTLFPSDSLGEAITKEFSPDAPLMLRIRIAHPIVAASMGLYLCALALVVLRRQRSLTAQRLTTSIVSIFFGQCVLGMLNVISVIPSPVLQLSHLLLMDGLWIAFVVLGALIWAEPESVARPVRVTRSLPAR